MPVSRAPAPFAVMTLTIRLGAAAFRHAQGWRRVGAGFLALVMAWAVSRGPLVAAADPGRIAITVPFPVGSGILALTFLQCARLAAGRRADKGAGRIGMPPHARPTRKGRIEAPADIGVSGTEPGERNGC